MIRCGGRFTCLPRCMMADNGKQVARECEILPEPVVVRSKQDSVRSNQDTVRWHSAGVMLLT